MSPSVDSTVAVGNDGRFRVGCRVRWLLVGCAIAVVVLAVRTATAFAAIVTLGFDTNSSGTVLTDQYAAADGIEFGEFGGGATGQAFTVHASSPSSLSNSVPNVLDMGTCESSAEVKVCTTDNYVHFDVLQSSVSFSLGFDNQAAPSDQVTITSYGAGGNLLTTSSTTIAAGVHTPVTIAHAGISFLHFSSSEVGNDSEVTALDDLRFNSGMGTPSIGVSAGGEAVLYTNNGSSYAPNKGAPVTATTGVSIGRFSGSTGNVFLSVTGLPPGVTYQFASNPFTGGDGASDALTLTAAPGTPGQALVNATVTATPSASAGTDPVSATLPVHLINGYSVGEIGMSFQQGADDVFYGQMLTTTPSPSAAPPGGFGLAYSGSPLDFGSPTIVHVYVDPVGLIGTAGSNLTVALSATAHGMPLPGSPLAANPPQLTDRDIQTEQSNGQSFDFTLPPSWYSLTAPITLKAVVSGPAPLFLVTSDPSPSQTVACMECADGRDSFRVSLVNFYNGPTRQPSNECTPQEKYTGLENFASVVCDVPQLDQMRTACAANDPTPAAHSCLPAPNSWCVPTAVMDMLAAFSDRGVLADPPAKNWTLPQNYKEMTTDLYILGQEMGTSDTGTDDDGMDDGVDTWLGNAPFNNQGGGLNFDQWSPQDWGNPDPDIPRVADIQYTGGLVAANLGFYENATQQPSQDPTSAFSPPTPTQIGRDGAFNPIDAYRYDGHEVAVAGVRESPAGVTLSMNDPAQPFDWNLTDASAAHQTAYETDTYHLTFGELHDYCAEDGCDAKPPFSGTGGDSNNDYATFRVDNYWTPTVINPWLNEATYIDGWASLTPDDVVFPETSSSIAFISDPGSRYHEHTYHVPGGVTHLAIDPLDPARIYYSAAGSSKIRVLNVRKGRAHMFANADGRILQLVPGGARDGVFARTADRVVSFDTSGHRIGSIRGRFNTITVDGSDESLFAASLDSRTVKTFSEKLALTGTSILPRRLTRGSGRLMLSIDATSKRLIFRSPSGSLYTAKLTTAAVTARAGRVLVLRLPHRIAPKALHLRGHHAATVLAEDGSGELLGVRHGLLTTFTANGKPVANRFGKIHVHGELAVTQSFHNLGANALAPLR